MIFTTAAISKPGGRELNEDCCSYIDTSNFGLWVVADGLGGHRGGEVASKLAVEAIIDSFRNQREISIEAVTKYLQNAQAALIERQSLDKNLISMRSTIVLLAADVARAFWAHVGDSRLYYFRGGKMAFQTKDHSVPQAMASAGEIGPEEIRFHEDRNRLLKVLGAEGETKSTIQECPFPLKPGDAFLLCSDGFWEYVTELEMEVDLTKASKPEEWLHYLEGRILKKAGKDHDNYTAIAVFLEK